MIKKLNEDYESYNYPNNILEILRDINDLDDNDKSEDDEFSIMTPNEVFDEVIRYQGLGNPMSIKSYIKDIYGIDLNRISKGE